MADYLINVFLDDAKLQIIQGAGLAGEIKEINGQKAVQVPVSDKEQKKISKGFPDLKIDAANTYVLPAEAEEAEKKLLDIIAQMKVLDVMKVAIMKIYNPVAGKPIRSAQY